MKLPPIIERSIEGLSGFWAGLRARYLELTPTQQTIVQNLVIWSITALGIWWASRGIAFDKFVEAIAQANIALLIGVNVASFFVWWLGDTILFAALFSFFHQKTRFRELLPATAAQYFLQAINIVAADGALIVFLNRRKGVRWLTATWTMMFAGLIDALALSGVFVIAGVMDSGSMTRTALPYASAAFVFFVLVAIWWAWGRSRTRIGRWMRERPSAVAFRAAGWREYAVLGGIRLALEAIQAFLYYGAIRAFVPGIPLAPVLALSPIIMAASNEPLTPQGLGPLQAGFVAGLARYAPASKIFAAALAISVVGLLCRLMLGLGAAGTFARRVTAIEVAEHRGEQTDAAAIGSNAS